jgi:hypothetical protein
MSSQRAFGWRERVALATTLVAAGLAAAAATAAALTISAAPTFPAALPTAHTVSAPAAGGGFFGSTGAIALNQPMVGMASTSSGRGYWLVAADGGIFAFGDAAFHGSTGGVRLNQAIVGMASTPSGAGYWLVASDGGIFAFGDAAFHGSTGGIRLMQPIVGMASTPSGAGYWLVAADGGVFGFGDAPFLGSAAGTLGAAAAGITTTPSGHGYWVAAADGTIRSFGDAVGAAVAAAARPVVGIAAAGRSGFWVAGANGSVASGGDATSYGSVAGTALAQPIVGLAADRAGDAYWLVARDGGIFAASSQAALAAPAATSSSYTFLAQNPDGSPIRFNPCAPVHYVVNLAGAPATAGADVNAALAKISQATGLSFVSDGTTDEIPWSRRAAYQPARYGQRWAPILIAWASPAQSDFLGGSNTLGQGGSTWYQSGDPHAAYVTGEVAVNEATTGGLSPGFGSGLTMGALLLHELGHVVGLGHTPDAAQIMYPDLRPMSSAQYQAGDLGGLARLGSAPGCLAVPPAG